MADQYKIEGENGDEDEKKPLIPFSGTLAPLPIQAVPRESRRRDHGKKYTCAVCQKGVGTKGGLRYHLRTHLIGRPFKCSKCDKSFATKNDLDTHFKRHAAKFTCDFCDKVFAAKDYLQLHIASKHLPKYLPCVDCCKTPKLFAMRRLLEEHYRHKARKYRNWDGLFHCKLCKAKFNDRHVYQKHCDDRELFKYECMVCCEKFPCQTLYLEHSEKEKGGRFCKTCKTWVNNFKNHFLAFHIKRKCPVCDFETTNRNRLYEHLQICDSSEDVKSLGVQCSICKIFLISKRKLAGHLNAKHAKFWCSKCSKSYYHEAALKKHLGRHPDTQHYKCVLCPKPKNFWTKATFNRHFQNNHAHPKVRPSKIKGKGRFLCDICKREYFETKRDIEKHVATCRPSSAVARNAKKPQPQQRLLLSWIKREVPKTTHDPTRERPPANLQTVGKFPLLLTNEEIFALHGIHLRK